MIGQTISHYKILEHLGGGGMGVVYKAQDLKLDRHVALKFLPPDLTRDPEAKQRFVHEAKAASALDHQNICVVHDIGEIDDGQIFIVMAFYEGETLKKKIERGPFKIKEAVDIAIQVAQGLTKAHEHGIIHRDIKPANVMVTLDGVTKIVDFGLAKLHGQTMLTKTSSTLGTAAYMSPEQARGESVDHRTDIWSLGVVLYEMLTARRPFDAEYENALMYSILNAEPERITALRTGVPIELERIIGKCMAKAPHDRYQHADEFIVDLRNSTPTTPSSPSGSPGTAPARRRRMRMRVLLSATALIVVVFSAWFFLERSSREMSEVRNKSIAVLPFSPFGRTFDDTVFADGIHDDILTQLSKISGLRVIARTSMVLYRDSKKTPQQIANELDVGYLLEGSTRHSGGKIRITAQLIKAVDGGHLWADTYDRNDADVFAVQSDIAQRIATSMEAVLSPAEKASLEEILTTNTEAYNYYLQGNYYWDNYFDSSGNAKAAELYERAAERDPTFAQAFARAAVVNSVMYVRWDRTPARRARITSALEKARALNPEDAIVHWAQGSLGNFLDPLRGRTESAKKALDEYHKALETRPNWAELHLSIGRMQLDEGLLREARESFRRYYSLSPMSLSVAWGGDLGSLSSWLKDYDAARKEADEYIARHPDDPYSYQLKAGILIDGFGDLKGARAVLEEGMRLPLNQHRGPAYSITSMDFWELNYLEGRYQDALACLVGRPREIGLWTRWWWWTPWLQKGQTYVALNQRASAMACFDSALLFAERPPTTSYKHYYRGMVLALRGEHDKAALELEKASKFENAWYRKKMIEEAQARSAMLAGDTVRALSLLEQLIPQPGFLTVWNLRLDPIYDPLRSNPRFQALLAEYQ